MNVQSKKIFFNKSSLLSLKAELLKKQEEVCEKKRLPENRIENFKPAPAKGNDVEKTGENANKKTFKDSLKAVDTEELEACRKSKLALEKKAELYEHLSDSTGHSQLADRFLVDFKAKKDEEAKEQAKQTPEVDENNDKNDPTFENDSEEWTEFTDCLGRTRKCLKTDLEQFQRRDKELMRIMFNDDKNSEDDGSSENQEPKKEKPFLVQKTNDYLQLLRQKWEEKERNLLAKDKDIHYQDLLFDEARIHGVGYYSFSTDEEERQKQMSELLKEREATLQAQKQAEEERKKREEIIAARVKAARARQRMRAGLPPEEPEDTSSKDFTAHLLEFLTQQRNEADSKAKEEEKRKKEEQEKERLKAREAYVREWDIGKAGYEGKGKRFREMSQEEYVEQQRGKRIDEFAPLKASTSRNNSNMFDDRGKMVEAEKTKTWSDVRPKVATPPPPEIGDLNEQKGLYFSTKKQNEPPVKDKKEPEPTPPLKIRRMYDNYFVRPQVPIPIINEVNDANEANSYEAQAYAAREYAARTYAATTYPDPAYAGTYPASEYAAPTDKPEERAQSSGVEVAPPPTYDYYGPVPKKVISAKPFKSDIREAYAQGVKSLETKSECRQISKDYDFMFD